MKWKFAQFVFNYGIIKKLKIFISVKSEDPGHISAIVRTGPRSIHVVRAGDLVPAGTMLVTPVLVIQGWHTSLFKKIASFCQTMIPGF